MPRRSPDKREKSGVLLRKTIVHLLAIGTLLLLAARAEADDIEVQFNGTQLVLPQAPLERGDRVFVPLRVIFEHLGATVNFSSGTIVATRGPQVIQLIVGSNTAFANGQLRQIDVPPFLSGESVMVPLRFVSESLAAVVDYDATRHMVTIWQGTTDPHAIPPGSSNPPPPAAPQVLIDDQHVSRNYGQEAFRDGRKVFIDCHRGATIEMRAGMRVAEWRAGTCDPDVITVYVPAMRLPPNRPLPVLNPSRYYEVVARNSGKALDVNGGPSNTADGAQIEQRAYVGSSNQQWQFAADASGGYVIVARSSGKAIDIFEDRRADGTPLHQWQRSANASQRWFVQPVGGGYYKIVSKLTGLALDVTGGIGATDDGAPLEQWHYVGNSNQQFTFIAVGTVDGSRIPIWVTPVMPPARLPIAPAVRPNVPNLGVRPAPSP